MFPEGTKDKQHAHTCFDSIISRHPLDTWFEVFCRCVNLGGQYQKSSSIITQ